MSTQSNVVRLLKKRRKEKRKVAEREIRQAKIRRSRAAKYIQKRYEEDLKASEAERKIKLTEAKTRLARARATSKEAEAEVWKARKAKWGAILSPPRMSPASKKRAGKTARAIGRVAVRLLKSKPTPKRKTTRKRASKK